MSEYVEVMRVPGPVGSKADLDGYDVGFHPEWDQIRLTTRQTSYDDSGCGHCEIETYLDYDAALGLAICLIRAADLHQAARAKR